MRALIAFCGALVDGVSSGFRQGNDENKGPFNLCRGTRLPTILLETHCGSYACMSRADRFLRNGFALDAG